MRILKHEKTHQFWFEGEDVLHVWAKPHPRHQQAATDRAEFRRLLTTVGLRCSIVGLVTASIITLLWHSILETRVLWAIWLAGAIGGPGILLYAWGQNRLKRYLEQRYEGRVSFRLLPDRIELYQVGNFKIFKFRFGDDTRYSVEGEVLQLLSNRLPNGTYSFQLPPLQHSREALLEGVSTFASPYESALPLNPARSIFDTKDKRMLGWIAAWIFVMTVASVPIDVVIRSRLGAWEPYAAFGAMLLTFAAGPGWWWVWRQYGSSALKKRRFRVAALVMNCITAIIVPFTCMAAIYFWRTRA